jgi:hypothetical protein
LPEIGLQASKASGIRFGALLRQLSPDARIVCVDDKVVDTQFQGT